MNMWVKLCLYSCPRGHVLNPAIIYFFQILETGQEIMELDQSGFTTDLPTVYAGNIGDDKYIVQVTSTSVVLMQSGEEFYVFRNQIKDKYNKVMIDELVM